VDVMRWMYLSQNPRINLNFGFKIGAGQTDHTQPFAN